MMSAEQSSLLRCKLPRKPWIKRAEARFYRCAHCGRIFHEFVPEFPYPPYDDGQGCKALPYCCGEAMQPLCPMPAREDLEYDIFGGFNNNAIRALWTGAPPQWILLQTYTGACLKQLPPAKKPPVLFPLADEDAYVYCDRDQCAKCLYCCKKSCALFYYFGSQEFYILPLDQVSKYFKR